MPRDPGLFAQVDYRAYGAERGDRFARFSSEGYKEGIVDDPVFFWQDLPQRFLGLVGIPRGDDAHPV